MHIPVILTWSQKNKIPRVIEYVGTYYHNHLRSVFFFNVLCNCIELYVRCSLINSSNLGIPIELFLREVFCKSNTTHPVNTLGCCSKCNF